MVVSTGNSEPMIFTGIYKIGLLLHVHCTSRSEKESGLYLKKMVLRPSNIVWTVGVCSVIPFSSI